MADRTQPGGAQGRPSPLLAGLPLSRRGFLKRSASLGVLLAAGAWLAPGCGRGGPPGEGGPDASPPLGGGERAVLRAVVDRLVPPADGDPGALALGVAERIERELRFHPRLARDVRDALRAMQWWPVLTRASRFTALSPEQQDDELRALATSRFAWRRSAYQGLKLLTCLFHFTRDATWPGVGYDGPWVPRNAPASVA